MVYRWVKDDKYIKIEDGVSANNKGSVSVVNSNAFKDGSLPVQFREQVPHSDKKRHKELIDSVRQWAEREGYAPAASDD